MIVEDVVSSSSTPELNSFALHCYSLQKQWVLERAGPIDSGGTKNVAFPQKKGAIFFLSVRELLTVFEKTRCTYFFLRACVYR